MKKNIRYILVAALTFGLLSACSEEDLEPTLQQNRDVDTSINDVNDLQAVINGAYDRLSHYEYYGRDVVILGEVFSDNAASNGNSNRFVVESRMDLLTTTATAETFWAKAYEVIGSSNIVINAEDIEGEQSQIDHIKGQAYALRALAHFDLVKFYGQQHVNGGGLSAPGVPYVTTFRDNDALFPSRSTVQEVRDMAYEDLEKAASLMNTSVTNGYINIYAVRAIEARIANYFGDWSRALEAAEFVVEEGPFEIVNESNFVSSFATDASPNTIFELIASETDNNGINGIANMYQPTSYGDIVALPNLAAIYDGGDVRGASPYVLDEEGEYPDPTTIIGILEDGVIRNVGKYPSIAPYDDNLPIIRLEEVVLIYAEALLETGDADEALVYLNMIPANRGADLYTAATKENILLERRKELAFEGFRFHDLARNQMDIPFIDQVIQTHQGPTYGSYNYALPIPNAEANANSNVPQNAGYN